MQKPNTNMRAAHNWDCRSVDYRNVDGAVQQEPITRESLLARPMPEEI